MDGKVRIVPVGGPTKTQQISVDLTNAVQKSCACGCKYFMTVSTVYTVPAVVSPIGQEVVAQRPALICVNCGEPLEPIKQKEEGK